MPTHLLTCSNQLVILFFGPWRLLLCTRSPDPNHLRFASRAWWGSNLLWCAGAPDKMKLRTPMSLKLRYEFCSVRLGREGASVYESRIRRRTGIARCTSSIFFHPTLRVAFTRVYGQLALFRYVDQYHLEHDRRERAHRRCIGCAECAESTSSCFLSARPGQIESEADPRAQPHFPDRPELLFPTRPCGSRPHGAQGRVKDDRTFAVARRVHP